MRTCARMCICVCEWDTSTSHSHWDCRIYVLLLLLLLFFPSAMHTVHTNTQLMEFQLIESIQYTNWKIIKTLFYCTTKCTFAKWKIHCKNSSAHTRTRFSLIKKRFYFILLSASNAIASNINLWGILCFVLQLIWFYFMWIWFMFCVKAKNRANEDLCWSSFHQCVLPSSGNSRLSDA